MGFLSCPALLAGAGCSLSDLLCAQLEKVTVNSAAIGKQRRARPWNSASVDLKLASSRAKLCVLSKLLVSLGLDFFVNQRY